MKKYDKKVQEDKALLLDVIGQIVKEKRKGSSGN